MRKLLVLVFTICVIPSFAGAQENRTRLNLMPWPAEIKITGSVYHLDQNFTVEVAKNSTGRLCRAAARMLRRISGSTGLFFSQDYVSPDSVVKNPSMTIHADRPGKLELNEDESYKLMVTPSGIRLTSNTDIGALRGIETFIQLLEADSSGYYFPCVSINDRPRFPWRGLMIDASRHFMPVQVIERNIDGMAAVKLNVFHWHLSDDQGFRAESKTFPRLTGMGSDGLYYTQSEIKQVIQYAADRGIRVVPEFDLPAHSTSWFVGYPAYASGPGPYTVERGFGVFNPVFNPTVGKTYDFLDRFFKEMSGLFPDRFMHIGGDENNGKQWNANSEIRRFMKSHRIPSDPALQTYFENRLIRILTKYHKEAIGWDEILNPGLPKTAVIQSWRGPAGLQDAVASGYRVILSNGYYLDHYMPAGKCYLNDPLPDTLKLTGAQNKLVLGGEACMWAEFVSPENVDSRIWPRAAAIAERLWSPDSIRNIRDMYRRLDRVSLELEGLGLRQRTNQDMMIDRLAAGCDPAPLKTFVHVVEPIELYLRARSEHYTSYSPLTRVADAAVPDPRTPRDFSYMVDDIVSGGNPNPDTLAMIQSRLTLWKNNDAALEGIMKRSPILSEIRPVSKSLSSSAAIGLEALNDIKIGVKADSAWVKGALSELSLAAVPHGEVRIMVVEPIEKLVKFAGKR